MVMSLIRKAAREAVLFAAVIGGSALATGIVVGIIWWNWSVWSDCRQTHSWIYCVAVLR